MIVKYLLRMFLFLWVLAVFRFTDAGAAWGPISFFREEILLVVGSSSLTVSGDYYFRNERAERVGSIIFYPLPVGPEMLYPDSISVYVIEEGGEKKPLEFSPGDDGIRFGLELKGDEVKMIRVTYRQQVKKQAARYILKSTVTWGGVLEEAEYSIEVPCHLELTGNSYEDFTKVTEKEKSVYTMRKKRFLPETDIVLEWRERGKENGGECNE